MYVNVFTDCLQYSLVIPTEALTMNLSCFGIDAPRRDQSIYTSWLKHFRKKDINEKLTKATMGQDRELVDSCR